MARKSTPTRAFSTAVNTAVGEAVTDRPHPETATAQGQLRLVIDDSRTPWRLDETTREIGREGVARAREVLRAARVLELDDAA